MAPPGSGPKPFHIAKITFYVMGKICCPEHHIVQNIGTCIKISEFRIRSHFNFIKGLLPSCSCMFDLIAYIYSPCKLLSTQSTITGSRIGYGNFLTKVPLQDKPSHWQNDNFKKK